MDAYLSVGSLLTMRCGGMCMTIHKECKRIMACHVATEMWFGALLGVSYQDV